MSEVSKFRPNLRARALVASAALLFAGACGEPMDSDEPDTSAETTTTTTPEWSIIDVDRVNEDQVDEFIPGGQRFITYEDSEGRTLECKMTTDGSGTQVASEVCNFEEYNEEVERSQSELGNG